MPAQRPKRQSSRIWRLERPLPERVHQLAVVSSARQSSPNAARPMRMSARGGCSSETSQKQTRRTPAPIAILCAVASREVVSMSALFGWATRIYFFSRPCRASVLSWPARDTFPSAGLSSPNACRQGGTHSGTVPTGRGSGDDSRESTAGTRGVGAASKKSGMALPATLSLTSPTANRFLPLTSAVFVGTADLQVRK